MEGELQETISKVVFHRAIYKRLRDGEINYFVDSDGNLYILDPLKPGLLMFTGSFDLATEQEILRFIAAAVARPT